MQIKETPNYYAVIPANVRYSKVLKANEKLLYAEITALSQKDGNCYATNSYFANLYNVSNIAISGWVSNLEKNGYITRDIIYKDGTKQILNRYLRIIEYPIKENFNTPIKENFKDTIYNNTSINNTRENNSKQVATLTSKHKYGEYKHVLLKDEELKKLNTEYGEETTKKAIKYLDESIEMKGYKYKSHYLAMRKWVFDAIKDKGLIGKGNKIQNRGTVL